MNEKDAKIKYCPFKFSNSDLNFPSGWNCDGSACMAWEWFYTTYQSKSNPDLVISENQFKAKIQRDEEEKSRWERQTPQGDCGMKPKELECNGGF